MPRKIKFKFYTLKIIILDSTTDSSTITLLRLHHGYKFVNHIFLEKKVKNLKFSYFYFLILN